MNTRFRLAAILLCLSVALPAGGATPAKPEFWLVDSLDKVFEDSSPPGQAAPSMILPVARNGHTSVQAAVRPASNIAHGTLTWRAVKHPARGLRVEVSRVGFVPVNRKPPQTENAELVRVPPGRFPDPLFPLSPVTLEAGKTQPFWISVYVPPSLRPGDYPVELELRAAGRKLSTARFTVRVVPAAVPAGRTLRVTNWFNLSEQHIQRHFPAVEREPERYWQFLDNLARFLAAHRQNVILTPVLGLAQPNLRNGGIEYDFERLDRFVGTFEKAGVTGTIEGGHLLGRQSGYHTPMAVTCDFIEDGALVRKRLPPEDPRVAQHLERFLSALRAHLEAKGWLGRYVQHIHDEPHGEERPIYRRLAQIIRSQLPGVPTVDAISLKEGTDYLEGVLDIWVPVLGSFDDHLEVLARHRAAGGQTWFYTCIFPQGAHLNRFTDYPLLKVRLLHWLNYRHGFTGFLHWGGNYWSPEPFTNVEPIINDGRTLLPAGDNAIVYPDQDRLGVYSSLRMEQMREGIEDYELLAALAQRNPAAAQELAREAVPNITDYVRDIGAFRRLQQRLLEAASK